MKPDVLNKINGLNFGKAVKIRHVKKKSGKIILYLENYIHATKKREKLFLGKCLTLENHASDSIVLKRVMSIRDELELVVQGGGSLIKQKYVLFIDFASSIIDNKKKATRSIYSAAVARFDSMFPKIRIDEISSSHANMFLSSLFKLNNRTKNHYIRAMRHLIKHAISQDIYTATNPFEQIKSLRQTSTKQFLSHEELIMLQNTECTNSEFKKAFLFSCYTGIRWGDINKIEGSNIQDGYLTQLYHSEQSYTCPTVT